MGDRMYQLIPIDGVCLFICLLAEICISVCVSEWSCSSTLLSTLSEIGRKKICNARQLNHLESFRNGHRTDIFEL